MFAASRFRRLTACILLRNNVHGGSVNSILASYVFSKHTWINFTTFAGSNFQGLGTSILLYASEASYSEEKYELRYQHRL